MRTNHEELNPEDFEPAPLKRAGPLARWPGRRALLSPILLALLFAIVSMVCWQLPPGKRMFVSGEAVFKFGEHWRLLAALFMHADWAHLLSNAPLFVFFGWLLRAYFGYLAFPVLAFVIGAGANLITICFYHATARLMGASGMVYGMIALWLVLYVSHDEDDRLGKRVLRASAFASLMLLPRTYEQSTSYLAHGSGFMLGLICGLFCLPFLKVIEE